ncbi:hypothetical protein B0I35DRAFT_67126 [Stachybotrys elegans]|uniref:Uncharacterized protein n=1 Tax=Stachybotrys elegans TaxID=80388 RepID=A0A8K0SLK6_9HYPO|nr:hypothetical protein B0I35DRAFT_67126 [Stachybotrys elegans]
MSHIFVVARLARLFLCARWGSFTVCLFFCASPGYRWPDGPCPRMAGCRSLACGLSLKRGSCLPSLPLPSQDLPRGDSFLVGWSERWDENFFLPILRLALSFAFCVTALNPAPFCFPSDAGPWILDERGRGIDHTFALITTAATAGS